MAGPAPAAGLPSARDTLDGIPMDSSRRWTSMASPRRRDHSVGQSCSTWPSDSNSPARKAARTVAGEERTIRGTLVAPARHQPLQRPEVGVTEVDDHVVVSPQVARLPPGLALPAPYPEAVLRRAQDL